jgi:glutamate-1-semialdehyde aminotransferase
VGGKADVLSVMNFDTDPHGTILVGGTFNGNPITAAAGTATLTRLKNDRGLYKHLNSMGDRYRKEINDFATEQHFPAVATGVGSMIWMHTVPGPVNNIRDLNGENVDAATGLKFLFRLNGLHISPNHGFLSAAHTDDDITQLIAVHKAAMVELRDKGIW